MFTYNDILGIKDMYTKIWLVKFNSGNYNVQ